MQEGGDVTDDESSSSDEEDGKLQPQPRSQLSIALCAHRGDQESSARVPWSQEAYEDELTDIPCTDKPTRYTKTLKPSATSYPISALEFA